MFKTNCCDGIHNSLDVHFTSSCDNNCAFCIDHVFTGINQVIPDINAIVKTILDNQNGYDEVLFLGGEPCLFLDELIECVSIIKEKTHLKVYVTTSVPYTCYKNKDKFYHLISLVDGINLSVQHHNEAIADEIRRSTSKYDRQGFYASLPYKDKIRINLNIFKPNLYLKEDIIKCVQHYDKFGFNTIKLSEIQHRAEQFVSFENIFNIKYKSPYVYGCQTYPNMDNLIPNLKTPLLLKRSCFICEKTCNASFMDGIKIAYKFFFLRKDTKRKYGIIYENGSFQKKWV